MPATLFVINNNVRLERTISLRGVILFTKRQLGVFTVATDASYDLATPLNLRCCRLLTLSRLGSLSSTRRRFRRLPRSSAAVPLDGSAWLLIEPSQLFFESFAFLLFLFGLFRFPSRKSYFFVFFYSYLISFQ